MGTSCYEKNLVIFESSPNENVYIIWIDENINNKKNKKYVTNLEKENVKIDTFKDIESGLNKIYDPKNNFKNIYLILSGFIYQDFILKFKKNLKKIYTVPKIIIFTKDKELFLKNNSNINDIIENKFYNLGGIQKLDNAVFRDFIVEKSWKNNYEIENKTLNNDINGEQYTFEYVNNKLELYLPVFYKALIKLNEKDIFDELTHYLYYSYKENDNIKELLEPIDGIPDIPIEILCKYYARLYTIQSKFFKELNKNLREENLKLKVEEMLFSANKNNYYSITFIKSFYEGIKLDCFNFDLKDKLYRFSYLEQKEIDKINEYLENKKPDLPAANFFSKAFLSFTEEETIAYSFYEEYKKEPSKCNNKNLVPIFFHLIKKGNINKSFYSHIKLGNISFFENEKEILFLPFTCFEILSVTPYPKEKKVKSISNKKKVEYYIIELTYLGQYEKDLKNIEKEEKIPKTEFRDIIVDSRLIELNQDITNKNLIDEFNEYEKSLKRNNEDIYILYDVKEEDIDENHYVQIFGRHSEDNETDFVQENKEKIKIIINNEEKALGYKYKLEKGENKLIFKLNSYINNLSYMFCGCTSLKSVEGLKYLDTKYVKNFSKVFYGCQSLYDIKDLENWDVSNGNNFLGMFYECQSLSDIKPLENWNVSKGDNFLGMFFGCKSLSDIKPLEKWNVSNGNNFEGFFKECESLSDIKPLKKWNVSNGNNFEGMFNNCKSLSDIEGLENWNVSNGNNFDGMFGECKSLSDIKALEKWNVSNGKNFSAMFYNCPSLSDLKGLEKWNVSNGNNFIGMFRECVTLSDIKALENWKTSDGNDFEGMFASCQSLSDIKPLENWNVSNGNNFLGMFYNCSSLSDIKGLQKWNVSNGSNFESMFRECELLSDITSLENWNVSNGNNFSNMFYNCTSLSDIKGLQKWNVSNGINFEGMFYLCESLSDINGFQNWNVSNGNNFSNMFGFCSSLLNVNTLENWNVSNGINFSNMFLGCKILSDIKGLKKWNVSNGNNFEAMFKGCQLLSDIKALENWNVSNGNNFEAMFSLCNPFLDRNTIQNWNTHGYNHNFMFAGDI